MLSKTRKSSPSRIVGGVIGVSALTLAALGLTASGTQAAETITAKVEAATGINLRQDAPPPPQDAPPPPKAAPAAPPAPAAAPDAPDAPKVRTVRVVTTHDGKDGKPHRVVMVRQGGEGEMPELAGLADLEILGSPDMLATMPEVVSDKCKRGNAREMVMTPKAEPGKRQRIIICTNRIEAHAADARRMGMRSALVGLEHARRQIENDTTLSADDKAKALKGIDEAIREVRKADKD